MQDFGFYFGPGWHHIISKDALDHQLFIMALAAIYMLRDWKQVLVLVTAFTIGHSVTLALSATKVITVDTALVEFLIAITIMVTAFSNLFQKKFTPKTIRINYFLALFFGLIHGLAYSQYIRFATEGSDQNIVWSLFGFNAGLEVGQIVVVVFILLLTQLIVQVCKVNRRDWVFFLSAGAFALALKMALDRFPT